MTYQLRMILELQPTSIKAKLLVPLITRTKVVIKLNPQRSLTKKLLSHQFLNTIKIPTRLIISANILCTFAVEMSNPPSALNFEARRMNVMLRPCTRPPQCGGFFVLYNAYLYKSERSVVIPIVGITSFAHSCTLSRTAIASFINCCSVSCLSSFVASQYSIAPNCF